MRRRALVVPASSPSAVTLVLDALGSGLVVAVPTDTVYGLVADPGRRSAVAALAAAKGRSASQDLQLLVRSPGEADALAGGLPESARRLAERFWPGALTIVVDRAPGVALDLGGDGTSIGMRCPDHPFALGLCASFGPLAASSANRHGGPPLAGAAEIAEVLGTGVAVVVDGGICTGGSSTVVDCRPSPPTCLREGSVPFSAVVEALA